MKCSLLPLLCTCCLLAAETSDAPSKANPNPTYDGLVYAKVDGLSLKLDLYLPKSTESPQLVLHIHGGGWSKFDRKRKVPTWLLEAGYAVASIDYRLAQEAVFPAQIHDCKGAVRWLRANAATYGYRAERIAATGRSAGAHLAMLLGVSNKLDALEGEVGGNLEASSSIDAVFEMAGPTDFLARDQVQPRKTNDPGGSVYKLLGGPVRENQALATLASPISHVSTDDAPLLLIHGLLDKTVYPNQTVRLYQAYREVGLPVDILFLPDAGHGGKAYDAKAVQQRVFHFLDHYLTQPN